MTSPLQPLPSPAKLRADVPLSQEGEAQVVAGRARVRDHVLGPSSRLLVIVGPCSLHDPDAALDYADRLSTWARAHTETLTVVMRAHTDKPRTTLGWRGLAHAELGSDAAHALRATRALLVALAERLPLGAEVLEPTLSPYLNDTLSWAAVGARTTESQIHRALASGLPMPVGFKNSTCGGLSPAIDGAFTARHPHHTFTINDDGRAAARWTPGNAHTHIVLRGGQSGPNYDPEHVRAACAALRAAHLPPRLMVDCNHGNGGTPDAQQASVEVVAAQIEGGRTAIFGVMLESFLVEGRQAVDGGVYGQSVTDACMGWARTEAVLGRMDEAVRARAARRSGEHPRQR